MTISSRAENPASHSTTESLKSDFDWFKRRSNLPSVCYQGKCYPVELHENAADINRVIVQFELGHIEFGYQFDSRSPIEAMVIHLSNTGVAGAFIDNFSQTCICRNLFISKDEDNNFQYTGYFIHPKTRRRCEIALFWNTTLITRGNTTLLLHGNRAVLSGEIGTSTHDQIEHVVQDHPGVTTLVFADVSAQTNDEIVQHTGRLIRRSGFKTELPENGQIRGGAIALFIAGAERRVADNSILTVSNWYSDCQRDRSAQTLWGNRHQYRIAYFRDMLGIGIGEESYFFIIEVARSNPYYRLTREEMVSYRIAT